MGSSYSVSNKKEDKPDYNSISSAIDNAHDYDQIFIKPGNYNGFFGKVSNFTWKLNKDNTYDISINLLSLGSVIESLKVNIPSSISIKEAYAILDCKPGDTKEKVLGNFKKLQMKLHPDLNKDIDSTKISQILTEAKDLIIKTDFS